MNLNLARVAVAVLLIDGSSRAFAQTWLPSTGPDGGIVTALAAESDVLFAGTSVGVFSSLDRGDSWRFLYAPLERVNALVASSGVVYAGTEGGVFRSIDLGATWAPIPSPIQSGLTERSVQSLLVSGGTLYAGTILGHIFRSEDGGLTWNGASVGLSGNYVSALVERDGILYAGLRPNALCQSCGGVFVSLDRGGSWDAFNSGLSNFGGLSVISILASRDLLLAGTAAGVFRLGPVGTWVPSGLDSYAVTSFTEVGSTIFAGADAIDETGSFPISGVFRSDDRGLTWMRTGLPVVDIRALASVGDGLLAAGDGAFRSDDNGQSWSRVVSGLTAMAVAVEASDQLVLAIARSGGEDGLLYRSEDSGTSWERSEQGLPPLGNLNQLGAGKVRVVAIDGRNALAAVDARGVYWSLDGGRSWAPSSGPGSAVFASGFLVFGIALRGQNAFAGTEFGIFRSLDGGLTWSPANEGVPPFSFIYNFAFHGSTVFGAGTNGVVKSTDGGISWKNIGPSHTNARVYAGSSPNIYTFDLGESEVFRSSDEGETWVSAGLRTRAMEALVMAGDRIFALDLEDGVFESRSGTDTWQPVNEGLVFQRVNEEIVIYGSSIAVSNGFLLVGTNGYSVQRLGITPRSLVVPAGRARRTIPISRQP
jgi:photosystem II stability/assembly factor-like uncharacterized protein